MAFKVFLTLLLIFTLSLTGVLVFIKGFLLSRTVVDVKSQCEVDFANKAEDYQHHGTEGCWMHGRFKKAIIVIIDALKYDFAVFNKTLSKHKDVPFYKNKLPSIYHLMQKRPLNSRIFKFIADPPTTTMQRLKGLTTGSLPTFVDAGTNFQSYEIAEDNIIHQLVSSEKKIKFLGDDTWLGLFPKHFYKAFDFPSFNVKDLHTVDNGILKHIYPEIRRSDWDVLIAHFLGVDHCGHRYGPHHYEMGEKLTQMDIVIRNISQLLQEDTILFVMGDHGMTRTGDHGGDSTDELEAALFIYSQAQLFPDKQTEFQNNVVKQTDFVPTFSLLLGLPIPYSNLGHIIPELFSHCPWWETQTNEIRRVYHRVKALRLNSQQINMYLNTYQQVASDLPLGKLQQLRRQLTTAEGTLQGLVTKMVSQGADGESLRQFLTIEDLYSSYLKDARDMCESVWAKFDLNIMAIGLLTIFIGTLLGMYFLVVWEENQEQNTMSTTVLIGGCLLHILYLVVHMSLLPESVPPVMAFILSLVLIFAILIMLSKSENMKRILRKSLTVSNLTATILLLLSCCIYFSNSFIVHEDVISMFFVQTMVCALGIQIVFGWFRKEQKKNYLNRCVKRSKSQCDFMQLYIHPILVVGCMTSSCWILLRLSTNFWVCREEQHACEDSIFILPLSNIEGAAKNQRYVFSVLCLVFMILAVRSWLRFFGNLNGGTIGVLMAMYAPPLAGLFMGMHWALQAVPHMVLDTIPQWQQVLMAQIVYVIVLLALIVTLLSPLLLYTLFTRSSPSVQLPHKSDMRSVIPTLYNQLKVRLYEGKDGEDNEKPPMVYGLGSVYSASLVLLLSVVSLFLALLLNSGMAPSLLMATLVLFCCLELYSATLATDNNGDLPGWSLSGVVMLNLLGCAFFYSTGHQATIPSIRFEAAYIGFYGDFNTVILPGFLIWMNTFGGTVFFSMVTPLLVFWPALSSIFVKLMVNPSGEQTVWQGDFKLFNNASKLCTDLFKVSCAMILVYSLKVLCAACAAAVHRRHLMVWKIFAPRFVYESAMFVTGSVCVILVYLFILRVDRALNRFVTALPSKGKI